MILLFASTALFHFPVFAALLRIHLSETVKVKCDALLFRSTYVDGLCYFAIAQEDMDAASVCSSGFNGSKAAVDVPVAVYQKIMIDKSKFRTGDDPGSNYTMCAYDAGYKCVGTDLMLTRCLIRAAKKMNFVDANSYCRDRGMEIPAPINELENRILRDVLVKDPAWVQKSVLRDNNFKWSQDTLYSKWTTCDRPSETPRLYAGSQNAQWTCSKDTASVIDRNGYWSNGGVELMMDVVCAKHAVNDFTKEEKIANYHDDTNESAEKLTALPKSPNENLAVCPTTCYTPTSTSTIYDVIGKAIVETRRGCEVLCDAKSKCAGFSFKEAGSTSSCALLATSTTTQLSSVPTTIHMKKTTGCAPRTNMTAEFGEDPCIDSFVPITQKMNYYYICPQDANYYIIRAIDANGRRITLDNNMGNAMSKSCDMWVYRYKWRKEFVSLGHVGEHQHYTPFVAAVCAKAGDRRCPCGPLNQLADKWHGKPTYPIVPNVINPCQANAWILWELIKVPVTNYHDLYGRTRLPATVNCKAGIWLIWEGFDSAGCRGMSCVRK